MHKTTLFYCLGSSILLFDEHCQFMFNLWLYNLTCNEFVNYNLSFSQICDCPSGKKIIRSSNSIWQSCTVHVVILLWLLVIYVFLLKKKQHGSVYWKTGSGEVLKNLSQKSSLQEQLQVNLLSYYTKTLCVFIDNF